mmetsp:Transcript_35807/g.114634  ORF Transcript_35807/g.114634 Transcript_35807/m.114634 type:complete len:437 (+) Transcript_35807:80-1390(+)
MQHARESPSVQSGEVGCGTRERLSGSPAHLGVARHGMRDIPPPYKGGAALAAERLCRARRLLAGRAALGLGFLGRGRLRLVGLARNGNRRVVHLVCAAHLLALGHPQLRVELAERARLEEHASAVLALEVDEAQREGRDEDDHAEVDEALVVVCIRDDHLGADDGAEVAARADHARHGAEGGARDVRHDTVGQPLGHLDADREEDDDGHRLAERAVRVAHAVGVPHVADHDLLRVGGDLLHAEVGAVCAEGVARAGVVDVLRRARRDPGRLGLDHVGRRLGPALELDRVLVGAVDAVLVLAGPRAGNLPRRGELPRVLLVELGLAEVSVAAKEGALVPAVAMEGHLWRHAVDAFKDAGRVLARLAPLHADRAGHVDREEAEGEAHEALEDLHDEERPDAAADPELLHGPIREKSAPRAREEVHQAEACAEHAGEGL